MNKKIIALAIVSIMGLVSLTACGDADKKEEATSGDITLPIVSGESTMVDFAPTLGDGFHFDGFDVYLGDTIEIKTINNKNSEHDGKDVIVLPLKITNRSGNLRLFNPLYMRFYSPEGTKTEYFGMMFFQDDVYSAGKLMDGATIETFVHFEYKGDGDYHIEFNNYQMSGMVKIPVKK